jgi:predicted ATPase/DNA-binding CsgD family transcriptional regulator
LISKKSLLFCLFFSIMDKDALNKETVVRKQFIPLAADYKSVISPILIGRTRQFDLITQRLKESRGRAGTVIVISGEAGIGKSRLVHETETYARAQGLTIFQGICLEQDRALAYAPFLDLLRTFILTLSPSQIKQEFKTSAKEIVELLPELESLLPRSPSSSPSDPESEKHRLFQFLTQFFVHRLSKPNDQTGLLLIFEDLHWSDDTSLEFLEHLIRRIEELPIVLILTYRSDEKNPRLENMLGALNRQRLALEISLQAFTIGELESFVRSIFELDVPLKAEFIERIFELAEGNPFFTEEILKSLITTEGLYYTNNRWDSIPIQELSVPHSIHDAVQRRIRQLSPNARQTLTLAAVAGRRFDFGLLQTLTKLNEQELLIHMKELVAAQLVIEESADQFAFRHALTREAVYAELLKRERKKYHALIAEALENIHAIGLDAYNADLSYHFYEAGAWRKAIEYSQRAGEKAQALYAPRESIIFYTRAIAAARQLGTTKPLNLLRARGQAYETVGEFDRARSDFEQALSSARADHDNFSEWQVLIDLGLLWAERDYQRTGDYFQEALDLAHQVNDNTCLANSLNRLGNWHANIGNLEKALNYHRQALVGFEELNDRSRLAETLDYLGMTSQINGDLVQGAAHYQRAVELFHELDDRRGLVSSLATLALCGPTYLHNPSVSPFSLAESSKKGEDALKIAREIRWRSGEIYAMCCLGISLGPQGEYQRALELLESALKISQQIEHDQWAVGAHCGLGALYLDLLQLPLARQHLEQALVLAHEVGSSVWIGSVSGWLGSACIVQNDFSRAEMVLDGFLTAIDSPFQTQMQRLCWCARAELALARGDPERALSIIDHLVAADPNITAGTAIPRLWKLRGDALIMLKRLNDAENELQAAEITASRQGAWGWLWRIHMARGKVRQVQSRQSEAKIEFNVARSIVNELAVNIEDQVLRDNFTDEVIVMLPSQQPVSARKADKEDFDGLTVREREVAALIAQGESNREIAETLVVSERTVESHVTNILAKLGFTRRARIAAWAVDKGLGKPSL